MTRLRHTVLCSGLWLLIACGQEDAPPATSDAPADQGRAMPDLGAALDALPSDTITDGAMQAQDLAAPPAGADAGDDTGGGGGDMAITPPKLPTIDPGMYKGIDPLTTLGTPHVVGAKDIRGFIHHMSWRHDIQALEMAYALGERKVNTPESPLYKDEEGQNKWVIHPWSTRRLQADDTMNLVQQFHARTRQGRNWCIYLGDQKTPKTLCHHHLQKQGSTLRWWQKGDGVTTTFDWPPLPQYASYPDRPGDTLRIQQDKGGIDALGRSDGTTYVTLMGKSSHSWLVRVPPDPEDNPMLEAEGIDPKDCTEDPKVPFPFQFMAWSVNEDALYFTTLGASSERQGRVWYALVNDDGSLQPPKPFTQDAFPQPWGLTFDAAGNLYVASRHHVRVYDAQGAFLGALEVVGPQDQGGSLTASALAFGGPEGKDLYVSLGLSTVDPFGNLKWPDGGEYNQGKLLRFSSKIPGAWRRRRPQEGP